MTTEQQKSEQLLYTIAERVSALVQAIGELKTDIKEVKGDVKEVAHALDLVKDDVDDLKTKVFGGKTEAGLVARVNAIEEKTTRWDIYYRIAAALFSILCAVGTALLITYISKMLFP